MNVTMGNVSYLKENHKHLSRWFVLWAVCIDCNSTNLHCTDLCWINVIFYTETKSVVSVQLERIRYRKKKNLVENWFHISARISIQYMPSYPFTEGGGQRYSKRTASGNCRYKIGERWFVLLCLFKLQNYLYLLFVLTKAHSADGRMNKQPLVWVNRPSLRMPAFPLNNKQRVFEYGGQLRSVSAFHLNQSLFLQKVFPSGRWSWN